VPDLWLSVVSPHPDGFELVSGDVGSPVILHVPHASSTIPAYIRAGIVLDDAALAAELATMTDAHTDRIALAAAARVTPRPWLFVNRLSRLVVDPERFPDDREEMRAVGMGAVYPARPAARCSASRRSTKRLSRSAPTSIRTLGW
jgi:N-formylglutamate deformylase